ncbi:protein ROOT INITIATION DEFECTIVE 3-like [Pyrus x bretschneideri]|uniref:protein ROOT INITIATION DEFECTIVE 3-like n=1 Tax=Pyrus x bretschneideri TaxID=225117 RepID=UPI00202DCC52|nr:protein ROOT INITIATION DEFECTIVE 3-like [Pyrus x bretschneideri]
MSNEVTLLSTNESFLAPSKSAAKSAPLRLTASSALANGSSFPLSSASLLPSLALSSTGPSPMLMLVDCLRNGMLTSHYRGVSCLVFSDDGSLLISGSEDGDYLMIIEVNRKATCACITLRSTLYLTVVVVGYGGCKAIIVSASQDRTCLERRKWEIVEKYCFPTMIDAVALDPGENVFFAGGRDVKIYVAALNARAHLTASMGSISSIVSRITV